MKVYNENVDQIIESLFELELEDLLALEHGVDMAIRNAKGEAKRRADGILFHGDRKA
jgi:hypothetical protein